MKTKLAATGETFEPDRELTAALERIRRDFGGDIGLFFKKLREKRASEATLFELDDSRGLLPAEVFARCSQK
jgi:hypothetical protein